MGFELKANAVNQIPKGTEIFLTNEPTTYIGVVVRGRVAARNESMQLTLSTGGFFGVFDLSVGHYILDYVAVEDSVIYAFPMNDKKMLRAMLMANNKDYRGLMVNSLTKNFYELSSINAEFYKMAEALYQLLTESYTKYKNFCREAGTGALRLSLLERMKAYKNDAPMKRKSFSYYEDLIKVPADIQKSFFGYGVDLTMFHIKELSAIISDLLIDTREVCSYIKEHFICFYNDGSQNLLNGMFCLVSEAGKAKRPVPGLPQLLDKLWNEFNRMDNMLSRYMSMPPVFNRERLEQKYTAVLNGEEFADAGEVSSGASEEEIYQSLRGSLQQLMDFSGLSADSLKVFTEAVNNFVRLKDRTSGHEDVRAMRRQITDGFYTLYRAVFLKTLKENYMPKTVELFLNFGFTDERLLSKEQILELCKINISTKNTYHCNIYTIREWLMEVYSGKREPSKNEFDMEYAEMLREQKKTGEISEEEEQILLNDSMKKLEYEIYNVFRYNHRMISGQPSMFVPVLCSEQMMNTPARAVITKDRMGQLIEKYREVDYSVFYRELGYARMDLGIEKEFIMKEVVPNIILLPAYGQSSSMWQELSCKRRDSAGRFFFPIMMEGSVDDQIIRTLGRFRWELCRTMQGSSWNNIQYKSLTSEYADYIQFYRRNKELTDERREKVKQQLVKGKNNTREVFVQDYELWIKSEAQGAMRLNKVSRDILSSYCPFNKEIRAAIETQPAFEDSIAKFRRERTRKAHDLEIRYQNYKVKLGIELPQELVDNLNFYKNK